MKPSALHHNKKHCNTMAIGDHYVTTTMRSKPKGSKTRICCKQNSKACPPASNFEASPFRCRGRSSSSWRSQPFLDMSELWSSSPVGSEASDDSEGRGRTLASSFKRKLRYLKVLQIWELTAVSHLQQDRGELNTFSTVTLS